MWLFSEIYKFKSLSQAVVYSPFCQQYVLSKEYFFPPAAVQRLVEKVARCRLALSLLSAAL